MPPPSSIQNAIWVVSTLLHFAIAYVMLRRKLLRTFPVFFAYTIFHAIDGVTGYFLFRASQSVYFWFYWGGEGVDAFMTLAVIQEVFRVAFAPYEALRALGVRIFNWLTVVLCIIAVITAVIAPASEINETMAALFVLDRSVQMIELGLVFFLFVFCKLFGMTWRHYVFGIAAGLAVMTSIGMVVLTIRTWVGQSGNAWYSLAAPGGFTLGNAVFAYYFASVKSVVPLKIIPRTEQLISWNRALLELRQR